LRSDVKKRLYSEFFGGFRDVKIEGGRVADDYEVNFVDRQEFGRLFYQPVKIRDVCKGVIRHYGSADGVFDKFAAGLRHLGAAQSDKLDIASLLSYRVNQARAVSVCAWLCGA
jgi:hypothetical protein